MTTESSCAARLDWAAELRALPRGWFCTSIFRPFLQQRWGKTHFKKLPSGEERSANPSLLFSEKRRYSRNHLQEIHFLCVAHSCERRLERNTRNWDTKGSGKGPEEAQGRVSPSNAQAERDKVTICKKTEREKSCSCSWQQLARAQTGMNWP